MIFGPNTPIIVVIFWIVVVIIGLLVPFFILKIRNQSVAANRKLNHIIDLLELVVISNQKSGAQPPTKKMKCPVCRAINNAALDRCAQCNAVLHPNKILQKERRL